MCRREVAIGEEASGGDSGMVLPFVPSVVTFQDIHYFVEVPKVSLDVVSPALIPQTKTLCMILEEEEIH